MVELQFAGPKGHLWHVTQNRFNEVGYDVRTLDGNPNIATCNDLDLKIAIYRARDIARLVKKGDRDAGVTGRDWVVDRDMQYMLNGSWAPYSGDIVELMDLGVGKVDIVVAVPRSYGIEEAAEGHYQKGEEVYKKIIKAVKSKGRNKVRIASEYTNIARRVWRTFGNGTAYEFSDTIGTTENWLLGDPPPADIIVDCSETGGTIQNAGGVIVDRLFPSTARLVAYKGVLANNGKLEKLRKLMINLQTNVNMKYTSIRMHVPQNTLETFVNQLPAMRSPTIAKLANGDYSVEIALPKDKVVLVRPKLYEMGATDILEHDIDRVLTKSDADIVDDTLNKILRVHGYN